MVETGTIGKKRLEYLDLANKHLASGDAPTAQRYLESFLTTIPEGNNLPLVGSAKLKQVAESVKKEFDRIEKNRRDTWNNLVDGTKEMDSWERTEFLADQRIALSLATLQDRINACWSIALSSGVFNE